MGNVHKPILSPSSSRLWVNCAKANQFLKMHPIEYGKEVSSCVAEEGEAAHRIA